MSSANPPYPWFNGIKLNPAFFASSTGDLTKAQANALYLRKTVPDSALALETFNGGISTNTINSIGYGLTLTGTTAINLNTPNLYINSPPPAYENSIKISIGDAPTTVNCNLYVQTVQVMAIGSALPTNTL